MTVPARDAERLRRLQALTDAALSHLELDELLPTLLERTHEVLGVDTCAILLLDEEGTELVARAAVGLEEEVEQHVRIPLGRGFAGRVAAERRPVFLPDVEHADVLNPILREKGIKSLLGVPLVVHGETIGVLHVGSLTPRLFDDDDVDLLSLAADRAAIAIEHARLYELERAARTRLERVQAVTDAAFAHLELDELLAVLLPRIRTILAADTCAVLLADLERRELVVRATLGFEDVEQGRRIPIGLGFAGRVAGERRPVIVDDVEASEDILNPVLRAAAVKSLLGVPLVARGELIGVLHVGSLALRRFGSSDVELLELVAARVALAVERARLYQEILLLDKLRVSFVANASHELRTPATSVYGALATLVERGDELPPETRRELLRVGYEQGARLRHLLEQLLDLSRMDARASAVEPRRVVLARTLASIARQAVPGTEVRLDVPADLTAVADPLVLDRVVSNLLANAVQHGEPPIVVSAERGEGEVSIAVRDGGGGVPPDVLPRLFGRFERGESGTGSGLGLAIARTYARAHGGDLVYEPADGGAVFRLTLPQA